VTYHAPGQVVAWAIVTVPDDPSAGKAHVTRLEDAVIATVQSFDPDGHLGVVGRLEGYPGVGPPRGGPCQDRGRRRAHRAQRARCASHHARGGAQRRRRSRGIRLHRALRHRRQARGVDALARTLPDVARGRRAPRRPARGPPGRPRRGGPGRSQRLDQHRERPLLRRLRKPVSIPTRGSRYARASPSGCGSRPIWATSSSRCARSPRTCGW